MRKEEITPKQSLHRYTREGVAPCLPCQIARLRFGPGIRKTPRSPRGRFAS